MPRYLRPAGWAIGDLLAKRVALMADWAAYLASAPAQVVPLRPAAAR